MPNIGKSLLLQELKLTHFRKKCGVWATNPTCHSSLEDALFIHYTQSYTSNSKTNTKIVISNLVLNFSHKRDILLNKFLSVVFVKSKTKFSSAVPFQTSVWLVSVRLFVFSVKRKYMRNCSNLFSRFSFVVHFKWKEDSVTQWEEGHLPPSTIWHLRILRSFFL